MLQIGSGRNKKDINKRKRPIGRARKIKMVVRVLEREKIDKKKKKTTEVKNLKQENAF